VDASSLGPWNYFKCFNLHIPGRKPKSEKSIFLNPYMTVSTTPYVSQLRHKACVLILSKVATIEGIDIMRCMQHCDDGHHLFFGIYNATKCYCGESLARAALNISANSFCRKSWYVISGYRLRRVNKTTGS